ncbi:hypothetical protein [Pseudobacteriovorax antillogorgiicola]|uniref:Uncharacterized protein n=1 Tax=Pseudobacteriovorax antillogorgiicola TaxID=1513793 RepID=A0A1Y6CL39_9BACT|nr:hypothetical protein [Pseudobacteriovorax antillogorgiicola]TCS47890.1 hypothetical protein EDD56_1191 [Pseudobacteriovorax antillogorgiicola]SMF57703.1 hypothetical protein SAMN06296036_1192 [Pseudobacteriovorax antillogorgiicola]
MKQCYIGLEFHTCRSIYKSCDDKSQPIRKPCNIYSESNLAEYVTQSHSRFVEKEQELLSELLTYIRYASKNDFGCYVATGLSEFEPGTFFRHFIETGAEHFEEIHGENPLAMNMERNMSGCLRQLG